MKRKLRLLVTIGLFVMCLFGCNNSENDMSDLPLNEEIVIDDLTFVVNGAVIEKDIKTAAGEYLSSDNEKSLNIDFNVFNNGDSEIDINEHIAFEADYNGQQTYSEPVMIDHDKFSMSNSNSFFVKPLYDTHCSAVLAIPNKVAENANLLELSIKVGDNTYKYADKIEDVCEYQGLIMEATDTFADEQGNMYQDIQNASFAADIESEMKNIAQKHLLIMDELSANLKKAECPNIYINAHNELIALFDFYAEYFDKIIQSKDSVEMGNVLTEFGNSITELSTNGKPESIIKDMKFLVGSDFEASFEQS